MYIKASCSNFNIYIYIYSSVSGKYIKTLFMKMKIGSEHFDGVDQYACVTN